MPRPELSNIQKAIVGCCRTELAELVVEQTKLDGKLKHARNKLASAYMSVNNLDLPQRIRVIGWKARPFSEPRSVEALCRRLSITDQGNVKLVVSIYQTNGNLGAKLYEILDYMWEHL